MILLLPPRKTNSSFNIIIITSLLSPQLQPPPPFLDYSSILFKDHYQTLTDICDFLSPPAVTFYYKVAPRKAKQSFKTKPSNSDNTGTKSVQNFKNFWYILKCSAQREKLDTCSIAHPHIHRCFSNQYQADSIFSALGHLSKLLFGISFCR